MMMLGVEVEIYAEIEAKQAEILRYINFYKSEKSYKNAVYTALHPADTDEAYGKWLVKDVVTDRGVRVITARCIEKNYKGKYALHIIRTTFTDMESRLWQNKDSQWFMDSITVPFDDVHSNDSEYFQKLFDMTKNGHI